MSIQTSTKRPRPIIRKASVEDIAWTPLALPLYTQPATDDYQRAGVAYAIVRPGQERWPLGIVSDHYKVTDHNETRRQILEGAGDRVTLGRIIQAGHGYHIAHSFDVKHMHADTLNDAPVRSRMVVVHDHTGMGALRAAMVVYVGNDAMGAIVRSRAIHVASQPLEWSGEIDAMIEKSILAQDALLDILKAAQERKLTDTDRQWIESKGVTSKAGKNAVTLFDAMRAWFRGNIDSTKMTWGVWERRLDDDAIRIMCEFLGLAKYGTPLDRVLGGKRYGKGQVETSANDVAA